MVMKVISSEKSSQLWNESILGGFGQGNYKGRVTKKGWKVFDVEIG